jgi:hypothetical protein
MKMTQADYAERAGRIDAGTASDDDRRLVELYEREGFVRDGEGAVHKLVATGSAEVIKGDESAPKKATPRKRTGDTDK